MKLQSDQLQELQDAISDRIYIQVENWHLYLSDAGLSEALAIECNAYLDRGVQEAARKALESVQVRLGSGNTKLPLGQLVSSGQIFELEEILEPYSR